MIDRALALSEADMQVSKKPSADDGTMDASKKLGLGRRQAEPVDEKHPDDNRTKEGFYLKDSDDDSYGDEDYHSNSDNDYTEDGILRDNTSKHHTKRKIAKEDFVAAGKLNTAFGSKKKDLAQEGTEQTMKLSVTVNN